MKKVLTWILKAGASLEKSVCHIGDALKKRTWMYFPQLAVGMLVLFIVVFYFWESIFITIHAGEAGVLYRRFANGTVVDHVHPEGFYFIAPWNILTIYPVRYQVQNHQMEVISNRGLLMKVSLVIRYRPEIEMLGVLHEEVGPDYVKKIVLPEVEAKYRAMLGRHELEDVFSSNNGILQEIMNEALEQVSQRFVQIDNVMVTNIELPPRINKAIEEKLKEQQLAESYVFKLDSEQKEATRRKIEAEGIMTYSRIVNSALNEKVLQWKGLEAASELTKSPNPKVVIIGSGRGNVPVFMDTNK